MEKINVKKSVAELIAKHTLTSAFITVDCYGNPPGAVEAVKEDLYELHQLDPTPLVLAAIDLVTVGLEHAIEPTTDTHKKARIARDKLGDMFITAKVVKG